MLLFSNQKIASSEFLTNLSKTLSSVSSQTKGVVSSAKLQICMFCQKKKKGHLNKH